MTNIPTVFYPKKLVIIVGILYVWLSQFCPPDHNSCPFPSVIQKWIICFLKNSSVLTDCQGLWNSQRVLPLHVPMGLWWFPQCQPCETSFPSPVCRKHRLKWCTSFLVFSYKVGWNTDGLVLWVVDFESEFLTSIFKTKFTCDGVNQRFDYAHFVLHSDLWEGHMAETRWWMPSLYLVVSGDDFLLF